MKKRWLIAVIAAYIIGRIYIATLSSYGFYHGLNEGWYSLIGIKGNSKILRGYFRSGEINEDTKGEVKNVICN